jgi:nitrite reductase/ring-hydroxylating ferredoxin subunit
LAKFERVCSVGDVPRGGKKYFNIKGKEFVLVNVEGRFFAVHNWCSHEQGNLSEGTLKGYSIVCPDHGSEFDVRSGSVLVGPDGDDPSSIEPISRFETQVQGEDVLVLV